MPSFSLEWAMAIHHSLSPADVDMVILKKNLILFQTLNTPGMVFSKGWALLAQSFPKDSAFAICLACLEIMKIKLHDSTLDTIYQTHITHRFGSSAWAEPIDATLTKALKGQAG